MLALAPDGGHSSHRAVISESTPTGLFRLITSWASTARCLGVPNGTSAPSMLISSGPSRPNWRRLSTISLPAIPGPPRPHALTGVFYGCHCRTKFANSVRTDDGRALAAPRRPADRKTCPAKAIILIARELSWGSRGHTTDGHFLMV